MAYRMRLPVSNRRRQCECRSCRSVCEHAPGFLVPDNIMHMREQGVDLLEWSERHLRAHPGLQLPMLGNNLLIPLLVPARAADGACIYYDRRTWKCNIHQRAPFGCSMINGCDPVHRREESVVYGLSKIYLEMIKSDRKSVYLWVWNHLNGRGLISTDSTEQLSVRSVSYVRHLDPRSMAATRR